MNNTLYQLVVTPRPTIDPPNSQRFITPVPREFTQNSSEYASSILDDRHILIQKIDSLKLQLAESQKREEYLRDTNQNLRDTLSKLQNGGSEQFDGKNQVTFLKSATFHESLESFKSLNNSSNTQASRELSQLKDYYQNRIREQYDNYEQEKAKIEKHYIAKVEQIRQQIQSEAKNYVTRQLQLMEGEIRVHFEKEKSKAQAHIRSLLADGHDSKSSKRLRVSSPSYFLPSPANNSVNKHCQSRLVPELHTSCIETPIHQSLQSQRSDVRHQQRDSYPRKASSKDFIERACNVSGRRQLDISVSTRNVATDLFCENCKTTFTPTDFFPHAKECDKQSKQDVLDHSSVSQVDHSQSVCQLPLQMKRPSNYTSEEPPKFQTNSHREESSAERTSKMGSDMELLQTLLRRKQQIQYKIQSLKHSKHNNNRREREMLQTDLDQLVLVIQKKKRNKDVGSNSKLHSKVQKNNESFCASIFGHVKNQNRIYLEDRPLMKKNSNSRKENTSNNQCVMTNSVKVQAGAPSTPTSTTKQRHFLKRF